MSDVDWQGFDFGAARVEWILSLRSGVLSSRNAI